MSNLSDFLHKFLQVYQEYRPPVSFGPDSMGTICDALFKLYVYIMSS